MSQNGQNSDMAVVVKLYGIHLVGNPPAFPKVLDPEIYLGRRERGTDKVSDQRKFQKFISPKQSVVERFT